jgi:hypothetical protein
MERGTLVRWQAEYGWAYGVVMGQRHEGEVTLVGTQLGDVQPLWTPKLERWDDPRHPLARTQLR